MKVKLTFGFDVSTRLRKNPPHVHEPGICFSTDSLNLNLDGIPIEPSESEEESEQESGSESVNSSESETASESAEESEASESTAETESENGSSSE